MQQTRKPVQPIFSRHPHHNKIAFLNWLFQGYGDIENLATMGNGFLLAAVEGASYSLKNNQLKLADILIFPVLTNANHGIELYLKTICWALNRLHGSSSRIERGHDLDKLLQDARSKIAKWRGQKELAKFDRAMANLTDYVSELMIKIQTASGDKNMDFSRYPISKNYENHFYVDRIGNVEIDLVNFRKRFKAIHKSLETWSWNLLMELDQMQQSMT